MTSPLSRSQPETSTEASGGENEVAFSRQFGDQVTDVVRGESGDMRVRRQRGDADPLVPLDLGDGGAYDVDERHRAGVLVAVLGAGEDQQVLAVAAHDRGEVVELEERGEAVGVLLAVLQVLDDGELALDQAEGAQGEVDERAVDGLPHPLQVGGGLGQFGRGASRARRPWTCAAR